MTIYVILYSFLICIAMSMGIFALTLPEVAVYTNMFYYTKNPMISRSNFQNAYLNFNEQAALQEKPLVTEIYFDYYFNEKRELYKFNQEEDYIRLTSLPVKDICLDQSESVVAYYYSYYNSARAKTLVPFDRSVPQEANSAAPSRRIYGTQASVSTLLTMV
ncbi:MAG: hypothetical protein J6A28_03920, partial [Clostridia bacterium]|nr:hypothetical protein [Clostridia bacterium]